MKNPLMGVILHFLVVTGRNGGAIQDTPLDFITDSPPTTVTSNESNVGSVPIVRKKSILETS